MPKYVTLEEYHVTVRVPTDLPDDEAEAMLAVLDSKYFIAELRQAVAGVVAAHPLLAAVRIRISR